MIPEYVVFGKKQKDKKDYIEKYSGISYVKIRQKPRFFHTFVGKNLLALRTF